MSSSLSFKPWDTTTRPPPPALKETLARVAEQRGHFREITESALLAEIEAPSSPDDGSSSASDDDESSEPEESSENTPPNNLQELYTAKTDMLTAISSAQQEIAMALDFISLLCTEKLPQAATTVSPMLKSQLPMQTLSVDFWNRMPVDQNSSDEEVKLSKAVRFSQLRESAEGLLAAAERLEGNVRRERVFWDQILSITERGWSVSRIPRAQGLLGVHFGFNGAAREFAERDLAALVGRGEDGGIVLERGVGSKPKAVRAVVKDKQGTVVGCSRLPVGVFDEEETGLEARIRAARDSLFDEELWLEMVREARGLLALGVNMRGHVLSFPTDGDRTMELELISLDEEHTLPLDSLHDSDTLAQAILLTARLLLSHSHRSTLSQKSQVPAPISEKKDTEKPVLALLRPLLRIMKHHADITALNTYLHNIDLLLGNAEIHTTTQPAKFTLLPLSANNEEMDTANLISALLQPLRASGSFSIESSSFQLGFDIETTATTDSYTLTLASKPYTVGALSDLCEAADEFLAACLIEKLHSRDGLKDAVWELDRRDGTLVRTDPVDDEKREVFCCVLDGQEGKLELRVEGGESVVWGLEKKDGEKTLGEVWKGLVVGV